VTNTPAALPFSVDVPSLYKHLEPRRQHLLGLCSAFQGCDAIEPAQGIKNASLKEDGAWTCSVMNKILDVHS
jgi:hypothetical protein